MFGASSELASVMEFGFNVIRSPNVAEGPRDALSVEMLSTAAQLYEKKSHLKRLAVGERPRSLKVTQGYRNCHYSIGHVPFHTSDL